MVPTLVASETVRNRQRPGVVYGSRFVEADLAAAVRARRAQLGRTQAEVCQRGGLGVKTLARVEAGERPSYHSTTLRALDRGLGWRAGSAHAYLSAPERNGQAAWLDAIIGALDAVGPRKRAAEEIGVMLSQLSDESIGVLRAVARALIEADARRAAAGCNVAGARPPLGAMAVPTDVGVPGGGDRPR